MSKILNTRRQRPVFRLTPAIFLALLAIATPAMAQTMPDGFLGRTTPAAGDGLRTQVKKIFPGVLQARVANASNNPVAGAPVTFSAPDIYSTIDLAFVGDSITQAWTTPYTGQPVWNTTFAPLKAANFGVIGDTTEGVLSRVQNGELDGFQPKLIVLLIGSNNIPALTPNAVIAENIRLIVEELKKRQPQSKIVVLGLLPREAELNHPYRAIIADINARLAGLPDGDRVSYIDIGNRFLEPDGTISTAIMSDGLHPTTAGYQIFADAIIGKVTELMTPGASASFNGSASATAVTDANGVATAPQMTANGATGFYRMRADVSGVPIPASFLLTNTAPASSSAPPDFNGDGKTDILWRHSSGSVAVWQMDGAARLGSSSIADVSTQWTPVLSGDFNADDKSDVLWLDTAGNVAIWLMDGDTALSTAFIKNVTQAWKPVGAADFNGDAKTDILWMDTAGNLSIWLMNGTTILGSSFGKMSQAWTPVRTADFNGDGKADILFRSSAGDVAIWLMDGTTILSSTYIRNVPTAWTVAGTGDFSGDGKADLFWLDTSGNVAIWLMNGSAVLTETLIMNVTTEWKPARIGDFNGDGKADVLWRHASGSVAMWLMNGTAIVSDTWIANVDTSWSTQ